MGFFSVLFISSGSGFGRGARCFYDRLFVPTEVVQLCTLGFELAEMSFFIPYPRALARKEKILKMIQSVVYKETKK